MLSGISKYLSSGSLSNVNNMAFLPAARDWQVMYAKVSDSDFTTPMFTDSNVGNFSIMKITLMSNGTGHFSMRLGSSSARGSLTLDGVKVNRNNNVASHSKNNTNLNGWTELSGHNTTLNCVMQLGNGGGGYWGGRWHGVYGLDDFFDGSLKLNGDFQITWDGGSGGHAGIRVEVAA